MSMKERKERVSELVDLFSKNESFYKSKKFVEAEARSQFIDSFLECLGWDVKNERHANPNRLEVVVEDRLMVEGNKKHPDYTLGPSGQKVFYIEAKQPSIDLKQDPEPAFQIRRYGYTAKMPVALLTDFEELGVYDTKIKPSQKDNASTARIDYYNYKQYVEKFEEIYNRFSFEAVDKGWFDEYAGSTKDKKGTVTVDEDILKMIEQWRVLIAEDIALHNEEIDEFNLTSCVQKIIDRIIFLRICEDKDIEDEKQLFKLVEKKDEVSIYERLKSLFEKANEKYNAGLFATDSYLNNLNIQDKTLSSIIKALYYPECQYEFSVLPVEILGSIYERFLGKIIRFTRKTKNGHSVLIEEKPEVQKAGGVFYTPSYIVDYIVKNTIGKKIKGLIPAQVSRLKFCDPACGSGSFLVGAFQYLLDWHLDWYLNEKNILSAEKNGIIYKDVENHAYKLSVEEKKRILLNNIYGVDIDAQAVEVTKLSLFLKLLENEGKAIKENGANEIFKNTDLAQSKILPSLKDNIKCGNSLIGSDYYLNKNMLDFGIEDQRKINCFDWEKSFSAVFENGGFDCVIGNPPYVKIQNIDVEQSNYIKEKYITANGKFDLYIAFVEKSLGLIKKNGICSFIHPHRFITADYGKSFKTWLFQNKLINEIVHFGTEQIFENATTYTGIFSYSRENEKLQYVKAKKNCLNDVKFIEKNYEDENIFWNFDNDSDDSVLKKIFNYKRTLKDVSEGIYQGIVTLGDDIFVLRKISENDNNVICFSKELNENVEIEKQLLKRTVKGEHIKRYSELESNLVIFYPHKLEGNKTQPYTEKEMKELFPLGYNYIKQFKQYLEEKKIKYKTNPIFWYSLHRARQIEIFENEKIITPQLQNKPNFTIDLDGWYPDAGGYSIILKNRNNTKAVLAILNSELLMYFIKKTSNAYSGDYYYFKTAYLEPFPIPDISLSDSDLFSSLVDQMMEVQKKLNMDSISDNDKKLLEQRREIIDSQINATVYKLYGLTDEEIKIIENSES